MLCAQGDAGRACRGDRIAGCNQSRASETLQGSRARGTILSDACEAVDRGEVHRDGGFTAAREIVLRLFSARLANARALCPQDAKTALQEWRRLVGLPRRAMP